MYSVLFLLILSALLCWFYNNHNNNNNNNNKWLPPTKGAVHVMGLKLFVKLAHVSKGAPNAFLVVQMKEVCVRIQLNRLINP